MASHRTDRLKIYGISGEVEKLINDRWKVTVRCETSNKVEDWYYANRGNTFADFDTAMDDEILVDGVSKNWTAPTGQAWANAKLVSNSLGYTPQGKYVATFIYLTLTSSWVNSEPDVVESTEQGLRTLTRTQVAEAGTTPPYDEDNIGASTITSNGKTLYLSGIEDKSDERMSEVVLRFAEAGKIREVKSSLPDGSVSLRSTYLGVEGSSTGPITFRDKGNINGFQTFTVEERLKADGSSIASGNVANYTTKIDFTYPGIVDTDSDTLSSTRRNYQIDTTAPITRPVPLNITVSYQTESTLTSGELSSIYDPVSYATTYVYGLGRNYRAFGSTKTWNGYKAASGATVSVTQPTDSGSTNYLIQGTFLYGGTTGGIKVSGDTTYPTGSTVLDIDLKPSFVDVSGTQYYKKIKATATLD